MDKETRSFDCELRGEEGLRLVGVAAVTNTRAELYGFDEIILPGAFRESIERDDIRALWNHDTSFVLGRNRSGTLRLREEPVGLVVEIDLPDTSYARDFHHVVARGDVSQMSFGFTVEDEAWEDGESRPVRKIGKVKLWEVSPVTFPAYEQTRVIARSALARAEELGRHRSCRTPRDGCLMERLRVVRLIVDRYGGRNG